MIVLQGIGLVDIEQLLDLIEVVKPMPVLLDKASGPYKIYEQILVMPHRERMTWINHQHLDQGEVGVSQLLQLVKVAIHGNAVRAGGKYCAISQAIEQIVNRPRLQIMLPNVVLSPLLHDRTRSEGRRGEPDSLVLHRLCL